MLPFKKVRAHAEDGDDDSIIDFAWVLFIGMNRLGFPERAVWQMTFGKWADLFEQYKMVYNFEAKNLLFDTDEKQQASLFDL